MNFNKLLLVTMVTAGALSLTGQAAAFAPIWPTDGDSPVVPHADPAGLTVIWHSGASASTTSLQTAVIEAFCDVTPSFTVDILENTARDFWSVACNIKTPAPTGFTAGQKILWNKRDEGGSGVGVGPVVIPSLVGFMTPSTTVAGSNCPTQIGTRVISLTGGGSATANLWPCSGFVIGAASTRGEAATDDVVSRAPDIGTSDIEPSKFASSFAENVSSSDLNLNGNLADDAITGDFSVSTLSSGLTVTGVAQLIFNTPVNLLMYQDLQRAQFPSNHALFADCNPAGANYTSSVLVAPPLTNTNIMGNTEKCMPSLMASEIRGITARGTTGAIRAAHDFQGEVNPVGGAFFTGTGAYAPLSAITAYDAFDIAASDETIQICRRVKGSGTQAQFNAMILGYPCDPIVNNTLLPEVASVLPSNRTAENESSSDVERCLNDFNNGTNVSGKNSGLVKRWAIGVSSLEKNTPSATGVYPSTSSVVNQYRFIKIDGYAPTLVNVHAGDYFDVGQQSIQYKTGAAAPTVNAYNVLIPFIRDPLKLPALNKVHAFGHSAWLGSPAAAVGSLPSVLPDAQLRLDRPVSWFRRVANSGAPNTCAQPSAFRKTTVVPVVAGDTAPADTDATVAITVAPQSCSGHGGTDDQNCYTP